MCGITGYVSFNHIGLEEPIEKMVWSLKKRGPDSNNYVLYTKNGNKYALGHTRLAIIDLSSSGNQPIENNKFIIVFNGEIYNYLSIKKDLSNQGVNFKTNTDTEVVLESISMYGIDMALSLFKGMWSFALFNKDDGELILCRDRVGVKPLYYFYHNKKLLFGSELKAIMANPDFEKKINIKSVYEFLKYGYINAPNSIFQNTFKVMPGQYLKINPEGEILEKKYWCVQQIHSVKKEEKQINLKKGLKTNILNLKKVLCESFDSRMVSDVPVGVFLSGGVDSSLLASILCKELNYKLDTFTIGFESKKYDESIWANFASKKLNTYHNELICKEKDALELIYQIPKVYDEPFGDSSAIPTMLVSKFARSKVSVALSADGGDEMFFGYSRYKKIHDINNLPFKNPLNILLKSTSDEFLSKVSGSLSMLTRTPNLKDRVSKLKKVLAAKSINEMYDESISYFPKNELDLLFQTSNLIHTKKNLSDKKIDDFTLLTDFNNYLPGDILAKVDRASMAFSLEARDPFLDDSIFEFAAATPLEFKYKNGEQKYILKKLLENYLPKNYIYRKKRGFAVPMDRWLNNELKPVVFKYLSNDMLSKHNLFNINYVTELLKDYYNNKGVNSHKIWFLLMFQMWYEEWM